VTTANVWLRNLPDMSAVTMKNLNERDHVMNAVTQGRPLLRTGISAAAVAGLALLGTACSSMNNTTQAGGGQTQSRYQEAVNYAKCMRANGDPSWPDPDSNGMFANNNGSLDESSNAYKSANTACAKYQTGGSAQNTAQEQQAFARLLTYSKCMRSHGITNYPDPTMDSTGVSISTSGIDRNAPKFQTAQQACSPSKQSTGN
jgi:hypothetical protein